MNRLVEDINSLPRVRPRGQGLRDFSAVRISAEGMKLIRMTAAEYNVAQGDLVVFAIKRLLSDLATQSVPQSEAA